MLSFVLIVFILFISKQNGPFQDHQCFDDKRMDYIQLFISILNKGHQLSYFFLFVPSQRFQLAALGADHAVLFGRVLLFMKETSKVENV